MGEAEHRQECLARWGDNLKCLDDEIAWLESLQARGEATPDDNARLNDLRAKRPEIASKMDEAHGAADALWGALRSVVDAMWEAVTPRPNGPRGGESSEEERP